MKSLYTRTHYWFSLSHGGSVAHTEGVLNSLSKRVETEILSNEEIYGVDDIPTTIIPPIGRSWHGELLYNFRFRKHLEQKLREFRPDFVYHRYNGFSFSTAAVCRKLKIPLILEFNSSHLWKARHWKAESARKRMVGLMALPFLRAIEPFNLRSAAMIVVVAAPLKEALLRAGVPAERVLVNPNGVSPSRFKPFNRESCELVKSKLGIAEDQLVIGFAGTFGPWHGIPELTEAILQIAEDREIWPKVTFVLFGNTSALQVEMKEKTGHLDNVLFPGSIKYEEIGKHLSICDILLSPHGKPVDQGEFFGSPTKMFEYMCLGKAIVASDLGQIGKVLKDRQTAYLCPPGSVSAIVKGIKYFVERPEERQRMGDNARAEALANHTWDHNIDRMLIAFERIRKSGGLDV